MSAISPNQVVIPIIYMFFFRFSKFTDMFMLTKLYSYVLFEKKNRTQYAVIKKRLV